MERLSKISEKLLKEIKETDANVEHWDDYFDDIFFTKGEHKYKNESTLRSAFGELKENGYINVFWAENKPYNLSLTSKGYSYVNSNIQNTIDWIKNNIIALLALIISIINIVYNFKKQ